MNASFARLGRLTTFALVLALVATLGALFAARPARAAATFTVTTVGDNPDANPNDGVCDTTAGPGTPCSLRAAIQQANASAGADTIRFNIPGGGLQTIRPNSELPDITASVIVDGYTQPGAKPNTAAVGTNAVLRIELDGTSAGAATGLTIEAANSVVKGLVVNRFERSGVAIISSGPGSRVEGCFIGTSASGLAAAGNGLGVFEFASNVVVGGTAPAARNLVSGNLTDGVAVDEADDVRVQGNLIGTDKSGVGDLGNGGDGVFIFGLTDGVVGGGAGAANTIAFNAGAGVEVSDSFSAGNQILRNAIFANGGLGIDLGFGDGPTPNDPGDADTGPNNLQNTPLIATAVSGPGSTTIAGSLNSAAQVTFVIRFFSNPTGNEGKVFRGQVKVTTNDAGDAGFTFATAAAIPKGQTVTATATSAGGDTSEFSPAQTVS